jgi:glutamine synthetase
MSPQSAKKFLKDRNVKYILAQFVDIHGAAKAKAVPAEHLEMVLNEGAGFAGFALWGFGMGPHGPDYMARGDTSTLTPIPWMPGFARMACDGYVNGEPYAYCSRVMLKCQLAALKKRGLTMYTGIEPEFMLLKRNTDASLVPCDDTDLLEKPCYDYKGLARSAPFLEAMTDALRSVGIDVYQIDHEDANGQFEVNFTYGEALTTADRLIFVKMAASEIAKSMGMIATFMPKPFSNRTGTGAHFHISIDNAKVRNLFHDDRDKNGLGLSKIAYHFMGGILAHAKALTAIVAPTINSYKRLMVGRALSDTT